MRILRVALLAILAALPLPARAVDQLSPLPVMQFFDNNGALCVGCKIFTFAAGTTTKIASYTDSTGGTPNLNPIITDSRGDANIWLVPGTAYKIVFSPATDTDPPTNPFWTVDQIISSTLTLAPGKSLTVNNTMTLAAGADGQTWTFPSVGDTVVTLGATQSLTNKTLATPTITNPTISGNITGSPTFLSTLNFASGTSIGSGSGAQFGIITGGASGTGAGPYLSLQQGITQTGALGYHSAILGGAFNANLLLYSTNGIEIQGTSPATVSCAALTTDANGVLSCKATTTTGTAALVLGTNPTLTGVTIGGTVTGAPTWASGQTFPTLAVPGVVSFTSATGILFPNIGATATGDAVCIALGSGQLTYSNTGNCNVSDDGLKTAWAYDVPGLDAVMWLRPGSYEWLDVDMARAGRQLGLKAQDVKKLVPHIVSVGGERTIHLADGSDRTIEGVEAFDYGKLTVVLIKAIQEMQGEIDALRAR